MHLERAVSAFAGALIMTSWLTACGASDGADESAVPTSSASSAASPSGTDVGVSTSPTPVPVSLATSCELLFDPKPVDLAIVVKFINSRTATPKSLRRAKASYDEVLDIGKTARSPLKEQIDAWGVALADYFAELEAGHSAKLDTTAFKAAGLEMTRICIPRL